MKPAPLTSTILANLPCDHCGKPSAECKDEMHFNSNCHPGKGVWVTYVHSRRVLKLRCRECARPVCEIAVAGLHVPNPKEAN